MGNLNFMIIIFIVSNNCMFTFCENFGTSLKVINNFTKTYNTDNCSIALSEILNNLSSIDNQKILDTWKFTTPVELYSLKWYNLVAEDMKCKWIGPYGIMSDYPNRYCMYQIYNDNLTNGFLFAFCIPQSCNETHMDILGQLALEQVRYEKEVDVAATIECSRKWTIDKYHLKMDNLFGYCAYFLLLIILFSMLISATILSEKIKLTKRKNGHVLILNKWTKFVDIFSIQSSYAKLVASNSKTDINILNIMRIVSMILMIFGHFHECTQMLAKNTEDFRDPNGLLWLLSNATIFVGTFFVIGGTLTSYVTLCKYAKDDLSIIKGKEQLLATVKASILPWTLMIVNRYIRLIFTYAFYVLLFTYFVPHCVFLIPYIHLDPMVQCPPRILEHILMLSNFDYKPFCMIYTWYLDVDFQLYVLCSPVVWLLVYKPLWGFMTSLILVAGSSITRVIIRSLYDFSPVMSYLMPFPQYNENYLLNHFVNHSKPYTWLSSYVVGMLFGYAAFHIKFKQSFKLKPSFQLFLWICTICTFLWSIFGIYWHGHGFKNEIYDGLYIAFSPLLWAVACGWIILHSHVYSTSSFLQAVYKLKCFTFLSNLSLGCCLCNMGVSYMTISFYTFMVYDEPKVYFTPQRLCNYFASACVISYLGSLIMFCIVEGPASNIRVYVSKKSIKPELKSN